MLIFSNPTLLPTKIYQCALTFCNNNNNNKLPCNLYLTTSTRRYLRIIRQFNELSYLISVLSMFTHNLSLHPHARKVRCAHLDAKEFLPRLRLDHLFLPPHTPMTRHLPCALARACAHLLHNFPPPQNLNSFSPRLRFNRYLFCKRGRGWKKKKLKMTTRRV